MTQRPPERHGRPERRERAAPFDPAHYDTWATVEVRYSDLDAQGHVNNATYLTYFEQGRIAFFAWLRDMALAAHQRTSAAGGGALDAAGHAEASDALDIPFVIAQASCVYRHSIDAIAPIAVGVRYAAVGRASLDLHYVVCDAARHTVYATGTTVIVSVDLATARPRSLPHWARLALAEHRQRDASTS